MPLEPGLYLVATPIGHLADITYRAVETLKSVDLLLCEDTRHTAKLCAAYGVTTPRAPYHEHNDEAVRPGVLDRLAAGAAIALVSDAGTPLISDPGYRLVREARARGVRVSPVPGPCAAIAALCAAGAPTDRFLFAGFPPAKAGPRAAFFAGLRDQPSTLIFYETPQRLAESLGDMARAFPGRRAVVARELTKIHEEFREGAPDDLARAFAQAPPKGEMVVILHPAPAPPESIDIDALLIDALGTLSLKDAAEAVAVASGAPRKDVYQRALALKARGP